MRRFWGSTGIGSRLTSTPEWRIEIDHGRFTLSSDGKTLTDDIAKLTSVTAKPGVVWAAVSVHFASGRTVQFDGIPNSDAEELTKTLGPIITSARQRERVERLTREFEDLVPKMASWARSAQQAIRHRITARGWLDADFQQSILESRPRERNLFAEPELKDLVSTQPQEVRDAITFWNLPFESVAKTANEQVVADGLVEARDFFATVEKSPLSEEQARAVMCFDNRVLLVAAAGSGKTSTLVAKAGYALLKGYFEPERILMLAFNSAAAAELRERVVARLMPLGLPAQQVTAKTFHAFSLDVIGAATGKKPSLAPWVESDRDLEILLEIIDELRDSDSAFRSSWDMFRLVFGQDLPRFGKEQDNPDSWDREQGRAGFRTLQGEVVKSRGEFVLANWLFYNGVRYVYESPYQVDTADPRHRQYRPDFYLPDANAYLEHWALDASGEPPPQFKNYKQSMEWKRAVHSSNGTRLLETSTAGLWSGKAFVYLERRLRELGVELDPNPDREVPGRAPIENPRLARTFRSFLTHVKSNRLSMNALRARQAEGVAGEFRHRHQAFLDIFERLWDQWEARLKAGRFIDFEDMLNLATDCMESGQWKSPYELVMVDEFQDASSARARLARALVNEPGRCLFAVGDDWQSINRFAGADLSAMTRFDQIFKRSTTLKLETTFRCPQSLCDISSGFVQKNPGQLRKAVRSAAKDVEQPVRVVRVADEGGMLGAVEARLKEISAARVGPRVESVYILGRYRRDASCVPKVNPPGLSVRFTTVHSAKGLEADHVIVPRVTSETHGFPSRVADDPVMQIAMPSGDGFELAEERRLFYVALTRAKKSVTLLTSAHRESAFISELVRDFQIPVVNSDGTQSANDVCPRCGEGFMFRRSGRYGEFFGCSAFPRCNYTRPVDALAAASLPPPANASPVDARQRGSAGAPWGRDEEVRLLAAYDAGVTVDRLAQRHKRSVAAIRARLAKLGRRGA